jgi:hypothetical protein
MSVEQFANAAQSTLAAAVTAGATTLTVASAATFPPSGNFRLLIDSEILLVTAVSGNTFTVTRGAEGTAAAAHANGAYATHVLTAAALLVIPVYALLAGANTFTALQTFNESVTSPFGSGGNNDRYGSGAGNDSATGGNNTLVGYQTGSSLTSGSSNVFVGFQAGHSCTTGGGNVGVGQRCVYQVTTGGNNMALGVVGLFGVTTGSNNVAMGANAADQMTGGSSDNTAVGNAACRGSGAVNQCTALGSHALYNATGTGNVGVGFTAGYPLLTTGAYNTLLGCGADTASGALNYTVALGYNATPTATGECALSPYVSPITLHGLSSTNTDRVQAKLVNEFASATDASYKGRLRLVATDFAGDREVLRCEATGAAPALGFFGTAAAAQQAGGAATAGAAYGANEQTMLNAAYQALRAYGLLT